MTPYINKRDERFKDLNFWTEGLLTAFETGNESIMRSTLSNAMECLEPKKHAEIFTIQNGSRETLLMIALRKEKTEFAIEILSDIVNLKPESLSLLNNKAETVLHYIARHPGLTPDHAHILISKVYFKPDFAPLVNQRNTNQQTALDIAAHELRGDIFKWICDYSKHAYQIMQEKVTDLSKANQHTAGAAMGADCASRFQTVNQGHIFWMEASANTLEAAIKSFTRTLPTNAALLLGAALPMALYEGKIGGKLLSKVFNPETALKLLSTLLNNDSGSSAIETSTSQSLLFRMFSSKTTILLGAALTLAFFERKIGSNMLWNVFRNESDIALSSHEQTFVDFLCHVLPMNPGFNESQQSHYVKWYIALAKKKIAATPCRESALLDVSACEDSLKQSALQRIALDAAHDGEVEADTSSNASSSHDGSDSNLNGGFDEAERIAAVGAHLGQTHDAGSFNTTQQQSSVTAQSLFGYYSQPGSGLNFNISAAAARLESTFAQNSNHSTRRGT